MFEYALRLLLDIALIDAEPIMHWRNLFTFIHVRRYISAAVPYSFRSDLPPSSGTNAKVSQELWEDE